MAPQAQSLGNARSAPSSRSVLRVPCPAFGAQRVRASAASPSTSATFSAQATTQTTTTLQTLTSSEYPAFLQAHKAKLAVIDFFAPMCGPCAIMTPHLELWSQESDPNQIVFAMMDCTCGEGNRKLASELRIRSLPTFLLYRGGQVVAQVNGTAANKLKKAILDNM